MRRPVELPGADGSAPESSSADHPQQASSSSSSSAASQQQHHHHHHHHHYGILQSSGGGGPPPLARPVLHGAAAGGPGGLPPLPSHRPVMTTTVGNTNMAGPGSTLPPRAVHPPHATAGGGGGGLPPSSQQIVFPPTSTSHPFANRLGAVPSVGPVAGGHTDPAWNAMIGKDNKVFDVALQLPTTAAIQSQQQQTSSGDAAAPASASGTATTDEFHVRIWGPDYLFPSSSSDQNKPSESAASSSSPTATPQQRQQHRLLLFLHGAGMSCMSFHLVACAMLRISPADEVGPTIAAEVSAASSASASAQAASAHHHQHATDEPTAPGGEKKQKKDPRLICASFDYRGHGATKMASEASSKQVDLDTLANDACRVIDGLYYVLEQQSIAAAAASNNKQQQQPPSSSSLFWAPDRTTCLIGHSLGGSVACAISDLREWRQRVFGLVLLDIVEGTAIESVKHMPDFLRRRPRSFSAENEAVNWFYRAGGMRSIEAAKVSVPSLLRCVAVAADCSSSGGEKEGGQHQQLEWIADLPSTEPYWNGWFSGMDGRFLHAICPRLLCLSQRDNLDKDLTVAHMQGQFQMEIFRDCGHYLMEDSPEMVAPVLLRFLVRVEQQSAKLRAVFLNKFGASDPVATHAVAGGVGGPAK